MDGKECEDNKALITAKIDRGLETDISRRLKRICNRNNLINELKGKDHILKDKYIKV